MKPHLTNLKTLLKQLWLKAVSKVLTVHVKRSIFLTFIFMRLKRIKSYDERAFKELNEACDLVSSVNALEMPAVLIEYYFEPELGICDKLALCDFRSYAKEVLGKVPFWVRYDEVTMKKDLLRLVKFCQGEDSRMTQV